jgi:hypothetical protein
LSGKGKATGYSNSAGARTLLNLTKTRVWQPWQAYADLTYEDVKHEIDAGYEAAVTKWEEAEKVGEKRPNRFTFQNAFLKTRYEGETEEMKAKVEEHRLKKLDVGPDEVNCQYQV